VGGLLGWAGLVWENRNAIFQYAHIIELSELLDSARQKYCEPPIVKICNGKWQLKVRDNFAPLFAPIFYTGCSSL